MRIGVKEYISHQVRVGQVNNTGVGKVVTVDKNGRHTVELDGGRKIMIFSATGTNYNPGDTVSVRYMGKDKRQAEIAGKSTRRLATTMKVVYR